MFSAVLCMAVFIAFLYVLYRLLQAQDASFMMWEQMVDVCCTNTPNPMTK